MATELRPSKETELRLVAPKAIGCKEVKSETGSVRLRTTCQTPALSRSHKVNALRSASSRKSDGTGFVPFGMAAAATSRELLEAPLICSFTVKAQPLLVEFCWEASGFRTTARKKFCCVSS